MWKKCKVVLLPTTEKSFLFTKSNYDLEYNQKNPIHGIKYLGWKHQHLYILSDDKIEKDDYIYHRLDSIITKFDGIDNPSDYGYYKVIASTDQSLDIQFKDGSGSYTMPGISQSFINTYISEYNKGNKIETVMVEYLAEDEDWDDTKGAVIIPISLKVNSDNSINIKEVKYTWTREEIIDIIRKYSSYKTREFTSDDINWIEKNL
ncbi:MAG: hypothetical protein M0R17_08060 [Candidatus Omnitrophica bacterium]|jgi:hypothetical protein|nr:hypothetical protein [Candidatus Omnitrophota bacterium]